MPASPGRLAPPNRHLPSTLLVLALPWIYYRHVPDDEAVGAIPYQDFFYPDPPPIYVFSALAYKLAGPGVVAARVAHQLMLVGVAWQVHRLGRWLGGVAAPELARLALDWALPVLALALLIGAGTSRIADVLGHLPRFTGNPVGADQAAREDAVLAYLQAHARPGDRMVALPNGPYYWGPPPGYQPVFQAPSRRNLDDGLWVTLYGRRSP